MLAILDRVKERGVVSVFSVKKGWDFNFYKGMEGWEDQ